MQISKITAQDLAKHNRSIDQVRAGLKERSIQFDDLTGKPLTSQETYQRALLFSSNSQPLSPETHWTFIQGKGDAYLMATCTPDQVYEAMGVLQPTGQSATGTQRQEA